MILLVYVNFNQRSSIMSNDRLNSFTPEPEAMIEFKENMRQAEKDKIENPKRFLEAWKQGIKLVGEQYFEIKSNVDSATDKWDLKPKHEIIERSLFQLSKGQAILLAVMYSFYNSEEGQLYLEQLGRPNISDIAAHLDKEYLEVIAKLFVNYSGW